MVNQINKLSVDEDDNDSGFNSDEENRFLVHEVNRPKPWRRGLEENTIELPQFIPRHERNIREYKDKEIQLWSSTNLLKDLEVDDFIEKAKIRCGFSVEQALALIFINNYNLKLALKDIKKFEPLPHQWSCDKKQFVQAYRAVGKEFKEMKSRYFPHKTVPELVEYYYLHKMEEKRRKAKTTQSNKPPSSK